MGLKRILSGLLILLCVFGCFGCRHSDAPDGGISATEQPTETADARQIETDTITVSTEAPDEPLPTQAPSEQPQSPMPEPTTATTPEPTPEPARYLAPDGVATVAWISDPQHYSEKFPDTYYAMTSFLRDHAEEMHLAYIVHTGDFVNHPDADAEWAVADKAQETVDAIPNGVLAGNHDVLEPVGYTAFCRYFGEKRYKDKPWYGGSFRDNRGHFDLITIGETNYIFVYMGFGPEKESFKWVKKTLDAYPDRIGVLCLHDYYTKQLTLSEDGKKWHDKVVKKCPNLYLVMCGHKYGSYCFPESFDDDRDGREDRTVYQLLFNYQASLHDGGGGYVRLIQIDDANGTMRHLTYSPLLGDFNRFDDPANREDYYPFDEKNEEFTLPLPWRIEH